MSNANLPSHPIILGSSSKFRAQILTHHNIPFTVLVSNINEKAVGGSRATADASELVLAVARAKADALLVKIQREEDGGEEKLVVTCDQVVAWEGGVREKPVSEEECISYLKSYTKAPAETHSAVIVTNTKTGKRVEGVDVARQHFHPIPDNIISQLIAKGDVMYCCGGFMIDDPLLFPYLAQREGDEDSIIGMPIKLLLRLLNEAAS
ncbi:hypothetical protein HK097_008914 [Rhizophlyctis rosea]|uniref:Maf-like protein n=1 Tax=Rhizophlyctis rosea TaxID=64517 RepID=A0AAD5SBY3_9FUNG|nr:hypothetical protein HK097_008914 [Rhizophlyctis rosea]